MPDLEPIRGQIRFFLDELSTRNEHHGFERLSGEVIRKRICSNVVPATGPVSSGGDHGRDLETYKTYLEASPLRDSAFLGTASEGVLVFACSTEKEPQKGKIRSDVNKIMERGEAPERIYFLSADNVPVGKRHDIQDEVWEEQKVRLEILDAQWLAEQLSERDLYWVAVKYLNMPSDIYPALPEDREDEWYSSAKERWRDRASTGRNYQEFEELRLALRHASRSERHHGDVLDWQEKVLSFAGSGPTDRVKRQAVYEVVVADVYAGGDLRRHEAAAKAYLAGIPGLDHPSDLKDAAVFLYFCVGAAAEGRLGFASERLEGWRSTLVNRLDGLLRETDAEASPSARCALLDTRGFLSLMPDFRTEPSMDVDAAVARWEELLELAPRAPMYPLDPLSDFLNHSIEWVGEHPRYTTLVRALDELVGGRYGDAAAADKARKRALAWRRSGRLVRAIGELHVAKVRWFAEETLEGTVLSMLMIARCYAELGLVFASKQYALAAAALADGSTNARVLRRLPAAVLEAADAEYVGGNWLGFDTMARTGVALLAAAGSTEEDEWIAHVDPLAGHASLVQLFCERFDLEDLAKIPRELLAFLDWKEAEELMMPTARRQWQTADDLWQTVQEQLFGRPFGDAARRREISWSALGVNWHVAFDNNYGATPGAEEFCALAQVVLAELADVDLGLLPTSVRVSLRVEDRKAARLKPVASNDGRDWDLRLPLEPASPDADGMTYELRLTAIVLEILREASVIPSSDFNAAVQRLFPDDLPTKVFVAKPYRVLYRGFIEKDRFEAQPRSLPDPPGADRAFLPRGHEELGWREGPGPGYDADEAREAIRRRYENSLAPIRHTLPRLTRDSQFCALVSKLRQEGWKDWHILTALANAAANERLNRMPIPDAWGPETMDRMRRLIHEEETSEESDRMPASVFSEENLRIYFKTLVTGFAQTAGLELHQSTPDFSALERLLTERYGFKDDVEHDDAFSACEEA